MKLELYNFRKIKSLSITFQDGEMTLLNGPNKAGKSTILNAISWILYGDAKRVTPKSHPKVKVTGILSINRVVITRTTNPGSLELKLNELTFVEDEARAYIEENYGKLILWKVSCCVENNDINNFLLATNTQRMDLLNSIAFGDSNPKDRLEKIEEEIKQIKLEIRSKEELVKMRREDYEKAKDSQYDEIHCRTKAELTQIDEEIDKLKKFIPKLRIQWNQYHQLLGKYNNERYERDRLELEQSKLEVPSKPKNYKPSNELYDIFIRSANNEAYHKRMRELNKLVKDGKVYKNDDKLLRETGARLEMIEIEKQKCGSINYNLQSVNRRIEELERLIITNEKYKKIDEYNKLKKRLQDYYSYRLWQLETSKLYNTFVELAKYDEKMTLVDQYMNILRRDKEKYEKLKSKLGQNYRKSDIAKLKKLEDELKLGIAWENQQKYKNFVAYRDYLIKEKLLSQINDKERPNNIPLLTLEEIEQIASKKHEAMELKNKIMKKKYKLKAIEESLATYNCPQCDTKLYLNLEQQKLCPATCTRKYSQEDNDKVRTELEELQEIQNQFSKYNADDLYLQYWYNELDKYSSISDVTKPSDYNEELIPKLATYLQQKSKPLNGDKKEIEDQIGYLRIHLGAIEDIDIDEDDNSTYTEEEINNSLAVINEILSKSTIQMEDVEVIEIDDDLTVDDINVNVLISCRQDLIIMDEIEEYIEGRIQPNNAPLKMSITMIDKEIEKINSLNFDIKSKNNKIEMIDPDRQYLQLKYLEDNIDLSIDYEIPIDDSQYIKELDVLKTVTIYDLPEYNYEQLEKSINTRKYMKEIAEIKSKITDLDESDTDKLKAKYEFAKKYEDDLTVYQKRKKQLDDILVSSLVVPEKPSHPLVEIESQLDVLLDEKELAIKCNAINKVYKNLQITEDELEELDEVLKETLTLKDTAIEIQCEMLDRLIDRINRQVNILLEKLLESPIIFEIKLYKELKTKNATKQTVNIKIIDGVHDFDNISDLCGGEKSMICVALTLVFNSMSGIPIIMFDETFAKMADEWKEEAITRILENAMGKTVICTIHEGNKGRYDNVVDIPNEDLQYIDNGISS